MQKVYMVAAGMALVWALRWIWWYDLFSTSSHSWTGPDFNGRVQRLDVDHPFTHLWDRLGLEFVAQLIALIVLLLVVHTWLSDVAGYEWGKYMGKVHLCGAIWSLYHTCRFMGSYIKHYEKLKKSLEDNGKLCKALQKADRLTGGTGSGGYHCAYADKLGELIKLCAKEDDVHGDARNDTTEAVWVVVDTDVRVSFLISTFFASLVIATCSL